MDQLITSRSELKGWQECKRYGFLRYRRPNQEGEARGLQRRAMGVPTSTGSTIHSMFEGVFKLGLSLDGAISKALGEYAALVAERGLEINSEVAEEVDRQSALAEGLIRGWFRARWPAWSEEYRVALLPNGRPYVEVEDQVELVDGLVLQTKTDLVAERKEDGALFVWSWKSTGYTQAWQERWDHDLQRLTEVMGVEKRLSREVEGVVVEGLYTGRRQDGVQVHPFIRGYEGPNGEVTHESCTRKGWSKFNVWERFTMREWVEEMLPLEVCYGQYLQTQPLERTAEALAEVRQELVVVGEEIAKGVEQAARGVPLARAATRNMGSCHKFGRACEFIPLCFGGVTEPLENGFMVRTPHHSEEADD